jgi:hypothetical protein
MLAELSISPNSPLLFHARCWHHTETSFWPEIRLVESRFRQDMSHKEVQLTSLRTRANFHTLTTMAESLGFPKYLLKGGKLLQEVGPNSRY